MATKKYSLTNDDKNKVKEIIFGLKENNQILIPKQFVKTGQHARFRQDLCLTRLHIKKLLKEIETEFQIKFSKKEINDPSICETINDLHFLISKHLSVKNGLEQKEIIVEKPKRERKKIVLNCICCNLDIERMHSANNKQIWKNMFKNGIVDRISAGYGSVLDGNMYVIAICDSCIKEKLEEGVVKYVGNYMFPEIE